MDVWCRFIIKISVYPWLKGSLARLVEDLVGSIISFCCSKSKKDIDFAICESCDLSLCKDIDLNIITTEKYINDLNKIISNARQSLLEMKRSGIIKDYELTNFTYIKNNDSHK